MTIAQYRRGMRAEARGLWLGISTLDDFLWGFGVVIDQGLTRAWYEGAAECGIRPEELSGPEREQLKRYIFSQRLFMGRFGEALMELPNKAAGGKLGAYFARLDTWVNRYNEVQVHAAAMACGDRKKTWVLGWTKKHCVSCLGFEGRVYRYSTWLQNGALPQSKRLRCNGYNCDCGLADSDQRLTPGRFPARLLQ